MHQNWPLGADSGGVKVKLESFGGCACKVQYVRRRGRSKQAAGMDDDQWIQ